MLKLQGIDKSFGSNKVLENISLDVPGHTVLGLVGENGAGKSTLMKILGGVQRADSGTITLDDEDVDIKTPRDSLRHGIVSVFQELTLINQLSVEDNLFLLDKTVTRWRTIDRKVRRRKAEKIIDQFGLPMRPQEKVQDLSLGKKQMLEIVRGVWRRPKVLLLDEPTSSLGQHEVKWLIQLVQTARDAGSIVWFVSHRWEEVTEFSDSIVVMRNGRLVGQYQSHELAQSEAVRLMTGHSVKSTYPDRTTPSDKVVLEVSHLMNRKVNDVSFQLHSGEILGLGGLVGHGQDSLLRTIFADLTVKSVGSVKIEGTDVNLRSPSEAIASGIAYVPEDRKTEGLFLYKDIGFNMTFSILGRVAGRIGFIRKRMEKQIIEEGMSRLSIKGDSSMTSISHLSGGNQQKILIQKWLLTRPRVLLLNDVTRGVDIGTKMEIYNIIHEVAQSGVGVLIYSTDASELVHLCNRVFVMVRGGFIKCLEENELSEDMIVHYAIGGTESSIQGREGNVAQV